MSQPPNALTPDTLALLAADVPAVVLSDDARVVVVGHPSGRRDHANLSALVRRLTGIGRSVVVSARPVAIQHDRNGWRLAPPSKQRTP
jgi:hypothetical protein